MKSQKFACLAWTVVFLAFAGASAWFVYRRSPTGGSALAGAFIGGIVLSGAFGWLLAIPGRVYEWLLIVRAKLGREPEEGKRVALIGTLRGHGELHAPFTRERCVVYEYQILQRVVSRTSRSTSISERVVHDGFAMVPLSIEHGTDRTRILAKPEIQLPKSDDTPSSRANAQAYVDATQFTAPPAASAAAPDLSHTDGRYRVDYLRDPIELELADCRLVEKHLAAGANVCAIGTYAGDRKALVGEVKMHKGSAFAIGAAWRVVNAAIGSAIFTAIAAVSVAFFCANFPLDAVEQSHPEWKITWPEIELERLIDSRVRMPLAEAGVLGTPGFHLQEVCTGCAKGRIEIDGRVIELRHTTYVGGRTIHVSAKPGDRDGLTYHGDGKLTLTVDGKSAPIPSSWIQQHDIVTALGSEGDYQGRITVIAPDRWIRGRVSFRVLVNDDAWLRGHTPPAQP